MDVQRKIANYLHSNWNRSKQYLEEGLRRIARIWKVARNMHKDIPDQDLCPDVLQMEWEKIYRDAFDDHFSQMEDLKIRATKTGDQEKLEKIEDMVSIYQELAEKSPKIEDL